MFFVKLGYGLGVTVIGLVVVFFALAILIALIMGMTKFFDKSKKPAPAPAKPAAPAPAPAPVAVAAVEEEPVQDDSEVVAAIMAALSLRIRGHRQAPGRARGAPLQQRLEARLPLKNVLILKKTYNAKSKRLF